MAERDALAPFVAPSAVVVLPDDHLRALGAAYARVGAGRRSRLLAGLAVLLVAVAISSGVSEIDPVTVWRKIGGLTSYLGTPSCCSTIRRLRSTAPTGPP